MDRFRKILLTILLACFGASFIAPPFIQYQLMQHSITVLGVGIFLWVDHKHRFSHAGYLLVVLFILLHILGARYIYSYVPYDEWTRSLFGSSITETFHFSRNHYDRFVHFMWGALLVKPLMECYRNFLKVPIRIALLISVLTLQTSSMLYEIGEWWVTLVFAPDDAEAYNGQQGDMRDSQEDMAIAVLGTIVVSTYL